MLVFIYAEDREAADALALSVLNLGNVPIAPQTWSVVPTADKLHELRALCGVAILANPMAVDNGVLSNYLRDLEIACKEEGIPVVRDSYNHDVEQPLTELRCPEASWEFRHQLGRMYRTYLKKNADYSPYNILGTGDIGLVTRLWDKMARIFSLTGFKVKAEFQEYTAPREAQNESLDDSYLDLATYGVIASIYRKGVWGQ